MDINLNIVFYIVGYLVGAIPFGLLLAKKFANINVKESGSKSIGATNVLRVVKEQNPKLAKKLAITTLILDALKGLTIMFIAKIVGLSDSALWMIGFLAVVGHCFSPYLNFEGGKGVATGFGVFILMLPLEAIVAVIVWAVAGKILKISSLSSLLGLSGFIIASYIIHPTIAHSPIWLISFIIFYKHIPNLIRVIKGEEKRVIG